MPSKMTTNQRATEIFSLPMSGFVAFGAQIESSLQLRAECSVSRRLVNFNFIFFTPANPHHKTNMSEVEAQKEVPTEEKTAEELKGTKRAAEVSTSAVKNSNSRSPDRSPRCVEKFAPETVKVPRSRP